MSKVKTTKAKELTAQIAAGASGNTMENDATNVHLKLALERIETMEEKLKLVDTLVQMQELFEQEQAKLEPRLVLKYVKAKI
jgi:hypothetical protein